MDCATRSTSGSKSSPACCRCSDAFLSFWGKITHTTSRRPLKKDEWVVLGCIWEAADNGTLAGLGVYVLLVSHPRDGSGFFNLRHQMIFASGAVRGRRIIVRSKFCLAKLVRARLHPNIVRFAVQVWQWVPEVRATCVIWNKRITGVFVKSC